MKDEPLSMKASGPLRRVLHAEASSFERFGRWLRRCMHRQSIQGEVEDIGDPDGSSMRVLDAGGETIVPPSPARAVGAIDRSSPGRDADLGLSPGQSASIAAVSCGEGSRDGRAGPRRPCRKCAPCASPDHRLRHVGVSHRTIADTAKPWPTTTRKGRLEATVLSRGRTCRG